MVNFVIFDKMGIFASEVTKTQGVSGLIGQIKGVKFSLFHF